VTIIITAIRVLIAKSDLKFGEIANPTKEGITRSADTRTTPSIFTPRMTARDKRI